MIKKGQILEVDVSDLAFGGKGIVKIMPEDNPEGRPFIIFVDGALPGQKIEINISKKKKSYAEGKLIKVIKKSELEYDTGFQSVPGAPWASLPVEIQRQYKEVQVKELFQRFADIDINTEIFDEYIISPKEWEYRNKMEYSFGPTHETYKEVSVPPLPQGEAGRGNKKTKKIWSHEGFGLGSKKRGQFWLVENLEKPSGLFDERFEKFIVKLRAFCEETGLPVYNQKTNEGFWRGLTVKKSFHENNFVICLITHIKTEDMPAELLKNFANLCLHELGDTNVNGIFHVESDKVSDSIYGLKKQKIYGENLLEEKLEINDHKLYFDLSLESFFQPNPKAAEKLYQKVLDYVQIPVEAEPSACPNEKSQKIFDLFCGTGTIAQIIAKNLPTAKVYGVEIIEDSIEHARDNAEKNKLNNLRFFSVDVGKFLNDHPEFKDDVQTIVLDPPRAGIAPKTLQTVIGLNAKKIIYVSCNPASLTRDTAMLLKSGYDLKKVTLVDQFPHTAHVESVACFIKKS